MKYPSTSDICFLTERLQINKQTRKARNLCQFLMMQFVQKPFHLDRLKKHEYETNDNNTKFHCFDPE